MYWSKIKSFTLYYFDMSNKPDRLNLLPYQHHMKEAADKFGVTERTIRRWLAEEGLYRPRKGWGRGKLTQAKAQRIRELYREERHTQSELAEKFDISQAMVCRIVNNQSHRTTFRLAGEAMYRITEE